MLNESRVNNVKITCDEITNTINIDDTLEIHCMPEDLYDCSAVLDNLLNDEGLVNVDLQDIVMYAKSNKPVEVRRGAAFGEKRGMNAAQQVAQGIGDVKSIIMHFEISGDISLDEIDNAAREISSNTSAEAVIIWGVSFTKEIKEGFKIILICVY